MSPHFWIVLVLVGVTVAMGLRWMLRSGFADRLAVDAPNERSLHSMPTPRTGGLLLVPCALAGWLWNDAAFWPLAVLAAAMGSISYLDDRRGLPVVVRLGAHLSAALVAVVLLVPQAPWWSVVGLALVVGWLTNLFNFMDGSDGLAGGMALFGFGTLAVASAAEGDMALVAPCAALAAGALGFLTVNYPPARVFLGDAGSIPLGFLAGALGIAGASRGVWPPWLPLMAFAPFITDATLTLGRRALRGDEVWRAHRQHAYQRMVRLGYGHAGTALRWYGIMLAGSAVGLVALRFDSTVGWLIVTAWFVLLGGLASGIEKRWVLQSGRADE